MDLYEFEGKDIYSEYGITVPNSQLIFNKKQDYNVEFPCILKAQVLAGGRGKAGGIKACDCKENFLANIQKIFNLEIKSQKVNAVLCEEFLDVEKELYMSITIQGVEKPTIIISEFGGMDIEEVARDFPEKIMKIEIDEFTGIKDYQLKYICNMFDMVDEEKIINLVKNLEKAFFETEAVLMEINPLGVLKDGSLVAMDSKVILDENSLKSKKKIDEIIKNRKQFKQTEIEKEKTTITFVPLNKSGIGLISDGAGTGMLSLDLIIDAGGQIASFCELGGETSPEVMYKAMELTCDNCSDLKSICIVLIGGFNRMDDMAIGITNYIKENKLKTPVFTRMCGTKEEEGIDIMKKSGLNTYYDLTNTILKCINPGEEI